MTASSNSASPKANWNYPTSIRFGAGRIGELAEACKSAGMSRPLLVTDPFLATQPMTAEALKALKAAGLDATMFSEIKPTPVETNVYKGIAAIKAGGYDGVVAFGGGSARLRRLQTGFVRSYALSMLGGSLLVVASLLAVRFV